MKPSVIAFSLLFLFKVIVYAESPYTCAAPLAAAKETQYWSAAVGDQACFNVVDSDNCLNLADELKNSGQDPKKYIRQCKLGSNPTVLDDAKDLSQFYLGCYSGVVDGLVGNLIDAAGNFIVSSVKDYKVNKHCNENVEHKKLLYTAHNATQPPDMQIPIPPDAKLMAYDCSTIRGAIFEESRYLQVKKNRTNPATTSNQDIGNTISSLARQKAKELGIKLECYNYKKQAEILCTIATSVSTLVIPIAALAKIKMAAGLKGALKADVASSDVVTAGIGATSAPRQTASTFDFLKNLSAAERKIWKKFSSAKDEGFVKKLKDFRGSDDLAFDVKMHGGEGQIFLTPKDPNLAIKRFFVKKNEGYAWKGVEFLEQSRAKVLANPALNRHLDVVKVVEKGPDWIVRQFNPQSVPLEKMMTDEVARAARREAMKELRNSTDPDLIRIYRKLEKHPMSENLHWSPTDGRILLIDVSLLENQLLPRLVSLIS